MYSDLIDFIYFILGEILIRSNILFLLIGIYFIIVKILKLLSSFESPQLFFYKESEFLATATSSSEQIYVEKSTIEKNRINELIERCPLLKEPYRPPWLWGRNGHVQTAIYGALGHQNLVFSADKRHYLSLVDGTTVTFDVFEPWKTHPRGDVTLALCPGIANSSESMYIRSCVHHAQAAGYRCAVLNHLGALKDEKLTSSRMFRYGGTEEYAAMVSKLLHLHPTTKFIVVGFSMGGNIVTKYLGEDPEAGDRIVLGISLCQGYHATSVATNLHGWESGRRIYEFIMTENMKMLLRNHRNEIVKPFSEKGIIDEQLIWSSTSFLALDEFYSRRAAGYKSLDSYYESSSSIHCIDRIRTPMICINADDDPIMPPVLWAPIKKFAESRPNFLFALTKHGGHLGFLEGPSFAPRCVTWLDRFIVEISNAAIDVYSC